jgi:hypothetical protein
MANFEVLAQDAPANPPDTPTFVPAPPPKWSGDQNTGPQPTKAGNANDGGALWWDHDDPGQNGHQGYPGAAGVPGAPGLPGGNTPIGVSYTITQTINGVFTIRLHGGQGQPAGQGGAGGTGGEGQDGGDSDDEQPAGLGGQGGNGGIGGPGGNGGNGGNINQFDLTVGVDVNTNSVQTTYEQGIGGAPGSGGTPGNGGPGGRAGSGGPQAIPGFQGQFGQSGQAGKNGTVERLRVTA